MTNIGPPSHSRFGVTVAGSQRRRTFRNSRRRNAGPISRKYATQGAAGRLRPRLRGVRRNPDRPQQHAQVRIVPARALRRVVRRAARGPGIMDQWSDCQCLFSRGEGAKASWLVPMCVSRSWASKVIRCVSASMPRSRSLCTVRKFTSA